MGLPNDFFSTNWRDGGLSLKSLEEPQAELAPDMHTKLHDSEDRQTRSIFRYSVREDMTIKGGSRNEVSANLGIQLPNDHDRATSRGTHCLLSRAMKAVEFM